MLCTLKYNLWFSRKQFGIGAVKLLIVTNHIQNKSLHLNNVVQTVMIYYVYINKDTHEYKYTCIKKMYLQNILYIFNIKLYIHINY